MTNDELAAIKERSYGPGQVSADLRALIAEVERLRGPEPKVCRCSDQEYCRRVSS